MTERQAKQLEGEYYRLEADYMRLQGDRNDYLKMCKTMGDAIKVLDRYLIVSDGKLVLVRERLNKDDFKSLKLAFEKVCANSQFLAGKEG